MQLRNARLCLDCEEVHDAQQCPGCASETFVFITRWVPAPERRTRPRSVDPPTQEALQTYEKMLHPDRTAATGWTLVRRGALGLALFGAAGWMWRRNNHRTADPEPQPDIAPASSSTTADSAAREG